jgi:pimeloyl-ACP methyl ester carboxylesterase
MTPIMSEYKGKATIISPSLRGFGWSSYKKPINSYEDLAKDIHAFMKETFPDIK